MFVMITACVAMENGLRNSPSNTPNSLSHFKSKLKNKEKDLTYEENNLWIDRCIWFRDIELNIMPSKMYELQFCSIRVCI